MQRSVVGLLVISAVLAPVAAEDLVPRLDGCCFIVEFDDAEPGACLNERYAHLGIHLRRGDFGCIRARDVRALGWRTPSPPIAASTASDLGAVPSEGRLELRFDRPTAFVRACFGNDGPGMSLEYRCDRPNGSSSGYGPLNGNHHLDENRGVNGDCDVLWFRDRFGNYAITIDRLQVSYCSDRSACTVVGDGEPYSVMLDHPERPEPCVEGFLPER